MEAINSRIHLIKCIECKVAIATIERIVNNHKGFYCETCFRRFFPEDKLNKNKKELEECNLPLLHSNFNLDRVEWTSKEIEYKEKKRIRYERKKSKEAEEKREIEILSCLLVYNPNDENKVLVELSNRLYVGYFIIPNNKDLLVLFHGDKPIMIYNFHTGKIVKYI